MFRKARATRHIPFCELRAEIKCLEGITRQQRLAVKELADELEAREASGDDLWARLSNEAEAGTSPGKRVTTARDNLDTHDISGRIEVAGHRGVGPINTTTILNQRRRTNGGGAANSIFLRINHMGQGVLPDIKPTQNFGMK